MNFYYLCMNTDGRDCISVQKDPFRKEAALFCIPEFPGRAGRFSRAMRLGKILMAAGNAFVRFTKNLNFDEKYTSFLRSS